MPTMNLIDYTTGVCITDSPRTPTKLTRCYSQLKSKLTHPNNTNREIIFKAKQLKFPGVTYDDILTLKHHINNYILKISRHITLLYQMKDLTTHDVLKSVVYAHIYTFTYCNPIWCTSYITYLVLLMLQLKKV